MVGFSGSTTSFPPVPVIVTELADRTTVAPSCSIAPSIRCASSASISGWLIVDSPGARAARSNARFVKLLDPGGRIVTSKGDRRFGRDHTGSGSCSGSESSEQHDGSGNDINHPSLRNTATMSSTGITNRRLSPSKSTGIAFLGLNKIRS